MIKRILLGIGGTSFTKVAIKSALELAMRHGARLTAVTVVNPDRICKLGPVPAGAGFYAKRLCENRLEVTKSQVLEAVDLLEKTCKESGVDYDVAWETGDPFGILTTYARYHDLTVFGLRGIFEYQLTEDPEKDLIRLLSHGVRPILCVSNQVRNVQKVMVAYSGSMESAKAMRHFVQFRLWPHAALDIVHFSSGEDDSNALLTNAAAYCRDHGYQVNTRMVPGKAEDHLLSTAQKNNTDMIVMGNGIRSIWLRKVLGDTVLKTLSQSEKPIFLSQ
ncbi:MAG: universal stress protein [Deltaproteobacteria bacterium]|nr:universal stress protein [Deltaproteobacteria bacterium]